MGYELQAVWQLASRRLLWLMGITLGLIFTFQYLELPYGNVTSSLSSADKVPTSRNHSIAANAPSSQFEVFGDFSHADNSTDADVDDNSKKLSGSSQSRETGRVSETKKPQELDKTSGEAPKITDYEDTNLDISSSDNNDSAVKLQNNVTKRTKKSSAKVKKNSGKPDSSVISVAEMEFRLRQSRGSRQSMTPRWSTAADKELLFARSQIESASAVEEDPLLYAPLYQNVSTFKRSYELMEKLLKVYIYKEGKRPIMHLPVLKGIYASEGWFMKLMESNKKFVTKDPAKAHLFYLPFSSRKLEENLYVPNSHDHKNLVQYLKDYVLLISAKYTIWNRTEGADHFLVACHDWGPSETEKYMGNCIRALCNADVKEGFVFGKDVSLPETVIRSPQRPLKDLGGKPSSQRDTLAFFAGGMHGYLRPILLDNWGGNKDPDMKIFGLMPKSKGSKSYIQYMKSSKYCICARGHEVNSPRVVEAIFSECVPVIISDNFVPPFFEVLNWQSFAVFVLEKDIPNLKKILVSIPEVRYREMQMMVKKVQHHFLWHSKPVKYDIFHMILHSIWYNRVFRN